MNKNFEIVAKAFPFLSPPPRLSMYSCLWLVDYLLLLSRLFLSSIRFEKLEEKGEKKQ